MAFQRLYTLAISWHVLYPMFCVLLARSFGKSGEAVPCSKLEDMFPNSEPLGSLAPYSLNVLRVDGNFTYRSYGYYSESLHIGMYTLRYQKKCELLDAMI